MVLGIEIHITIHDYTFIVSCYLLFMLRSLCYLEHGEPPGKTVYHKGLMGRPWLTN
jgi:hypothetical protein